MSCTEGYNGYGIYDPAKKYLLYNQEMHYKTIRDIYKRKTKLDILKNGYPQIWNYHFLSIHNCIIACSVLIHKIIIDKIGYKLEIPMGGVNINGKDIHIDYEYWLRALKYTNCVYINQPCVYYDSGHGDGNLY